MLPKITELNREQAETLPELGKSFLYDFDKGEFILKDGKLVQVEGLESLKMWIVKVIKTERFKFHIYENTGYGATIEDILGTNYPKVFIEAELKREITESLLKHPHIQNILNWQFNREGARMSISFTVVTVDSNFNQEVTL